MEREERWGEEGSLSLTTRRCRCCFWRGLACRQRSFFRSCFFALHSSLSAAAWDPHEGGTHLTTKGMVSGKASCRECAVRATEKASPSPSSALWLSTCQGREVKSGVHGQLLPQGQAKQRVWAQQLGKNERCEAHARGCVVWAVGWGRCSGCEQQTLIESPRSLPTTRHAPAVRPKP